MNQYQMAVPCLLGVEGFVADELRAMEAQNVEPQNGRVLFTGGDELLARANLWCRYGERVLIQLGSFRAVTFEELFQGVRALPWEDVCISSFDGLRLHGRLIRGEGDTVILVHGYHSSAENDFAGIAQWYVRRGCTVLAVDQRSHGRSEGRSVTFGYREQRDAVAWAQFAEYELGSERVWMHGVSMGAVSVLLALEDGYPDCVRGVIADCPFDSPVGLFAFHLRKRFHLPPFPVVPIGTLAWALMIGPDFVKDSCHSAAAESALPLLLFSAGEEETCVPQFISGKKREEASAGALLGTAVHRVLECLDFTREPLGDSLEDQIRQMEEDGRLLEDQVKRIPLEKVRKFLGTSIAGRMAVAAAAGCLFLEQPFVMGDLPEKIFGDGSASEEMLLVQGIIDVFFEEEDGIVLLDYKTDRVREAEELIRRYRRQLELYGEALERTRGKRVKERYLYSFALGETIRV